MNAISHFNLQGDSDKPIIRSIRHPRGSSIEVFAEEGFNESAGSFFSEYVAIENSEMEEGDREDTICTTFRFQGFEEDETTDGVLTRPMPQKSLQFVYQDCPPDVAQLHDYWVPQWGRPLWEPATCASLLARPSWRAFAPVQAQNLFRAREWLSLLPIASSTFINRSRICKSLLFVSHSTFFPPGSSQHPHFYPFPPELTLIF